jgi:hypothetical protein
VEQVLDICTIIVVKFSRMLTDGELSRSNAVLEHFKDEWCKDVDISKTCLRFYV